MARELPSKEWSVEILLWSERKKNNKVDKWEGGRFVFEYVEVFKEERLDLCFEQRYREIRYAMYLKRQKFSLGVGFEG